MFLINLHDDIFNQFFDHDRTDMSANLRLCIGIRGILTSCIPSLRTLRRVHEKKCDFSCAREKFWPDALPDAGMGDHGYGMVY